jgi:NTE family protein
MFKKKHKYCLVLAGGGARGAYEIGAWKALRELNIDFEAVGGTSVGALNSAFIAQNDFELGMKVWSEITMDKVINVPEGMLEKGRFKFSLRNITHIRELNLDIRNLGLDSEPLYNMIREELKEEKIRKSGMDMGLVTVKLKNLKPCEIFLDEIPVGTLADYLLASASFPVFKRAEINGNHFTDGGVYDNIPFTMMKNRGYRRIIVVDISGLGVTRRPDMAGTETVYIKNSMNLGNMLDFNPDKAKDNIKLGYLDTMKVYGKNTGIKYFITGDSRIYNYYLNKLREEKYISRYSKYLKLSGRKCVPENAEQMVREVLPADQKHRRDIVLCLVEAAAVSLDIERNRLYSLEELVGLIKTEYSRIMQSSVAPSQKESENFFEKIGERISLFLSERDSGGFSPYEHALMIQNHRAAKALFPELPPAEIFLTLISED